MRRLSYIAIGVGSIALPFVCSMVFPLPSFFPFSDVVFFGVVSFVSFIAGCAMLPEMALRSSEEIFLRALIVKHGERTSEILAAAEAMQKFYDLIGRLSSTQFIESIDERILVLCGRYKESIANIEANPSSYRDYRALLSRSIVGVEAIEEHVKLLKIKGVPAERLSESRESVFVALTALEEGIEAAYDQISAQQIGRVDVAASVAETVLAKV